MTFQYGNPLEFKAPDLAAGEFTGYLAIFREVDLGSDQIQKGAFQDTLAETKARGIPIPLLWAHRSDVVLGKFTDLHEDEKGLFARGRLTLESNVAREKYALLKDQAVTGLSIGFSLPDGGWSVKEGVRLLHKINLHEGSLVAIPMAQSARVEHVKSLAETSLQDEIDRIKAFQTQLRGL